MYQQTDIFRDVWKNLQQIDCSTTSGEAPKIVRTKGDNSPKTFKLTRIALRFLFKEIMYDFYR